MSSDKTNLLNRQDQQLEAALYQLMDAVRLVFGSTTREDPIEGDGGYLLIFGRQVVLVGKNSSIISEGGPFEVLNDLRAFDAFQKRLRQGGEDG